MVEGYSKQQIAKGRAKFITMSIIGIILFLIPVPVTQDGEKQTTLPVAFLANWLKGLLGDAMPIIIIFIITLSAILTVLYSTIFKSKVKPGGLLDSAFKVGPVWMTLRILAVVFVWMTYFKLGSKVIYSEDTGGLVFYDLLPTLVAVFLFLCTILTFLMEYGLLEFLGPYLDQL